MVLWDIFVTNFSNETNTLYHNTADGALIDFTNIAGLGEVSFLKLAFGQSSSMRPTTAH